MYVILSSVCFNDKYGTDLDFNHLYVIPSLLSNLPHGKLTEQNAIKDFIWRLINEFVERCRGYNFPVQFSVFQFPVTVEPVAVLVWEND